MSSPEDNLLDWLRDAHAMEEQAEKMLEATASRVKNYPVLREKLLSHLEETRGQAKLVRGCIERRGGDTSAVKDFVAKATAMAQGLGGMVMDDEVVKASIASYTFEHFEIASYRTLIGAAQAVGDVETQTVCEGILKEEEAMAAWLEAQIPSLTQTFFSRVAAGIEAKR